MEFDGEYLDWRLQQHPQRRLQVRFLHENNDIVAFAVVNAERRLRLVILNAAFTSPSAGRVLLARLFEEFAGSDAVMVLLAANRWNPLGRYLREAAFFFSSIRRHTRYIGDWSSDVCSSDLSTALRPAPTARSAASHEPGETTVSPSSCFR